MNGQLFFEIGGAIFASRRFFHFLRQGPLVIVRRYGGPFTPAASGSIELLLATDTVGCEGDRHQTLERNCFAALEAEAVFACVKPNERFIEVPEFLLRACDEACMSFDLRGGASRIHFVSRL